MPQPNGAQPEVTYSNEETRVMLADAQALLARSDSLLHRYQADYARLTTELEKRLTRLAIRDARIAQLQADLARAHQPTPHPPPADQTEALEAARAENRRLAATLLAVQGELYQLQRSRPIRLAQVYWDLRKWLRAWLSRARP